MPNHNTVNFFSWFVARAPAEIIKLTRNFSAWAWNFFSIGYLAKQIFSPWHRDISYYGRGFDLRRFLHTAGWNLISRFIGAALRIVVIATGLVVEAGIAALGIFCFAFWYALPLVSVLFFLAGIFSLFK